MNTTQTHNSGLLLEQSQTLIMPQGKRTYSCMELGMGQSRQPACAGCTVHDYQQPRKPLNFAPGVIERLSPKRASRLKKAALRIANLLLICAGAGLSLGYMATKAGWL